MEAPPSSSAGSPPSASSSFPGSVSAGVGGFSSSRLMEGVGSPAGAVRDLGSFSTRVTELSARSASVPAAACSRTPPWLTTLQPFLVGGVAGCVATTCIQPIDMVKVRIQLVGQGGGSKKPFVVARNIIKEEGPLALYKGLDAGITRQLFYTTGRMGLFRVLCDWARDRRPTGDALPLWQKSSAGLVAGGLASVIGNPADLALVRLQADATLPPELRRRYTGVGNAICRVVKEEGPLALWRGCAPTVLRAMTLNMGMLATFDHAKEALKDRLGDGPSCLVSSAALSGLAAVTLSLPFDFIKTRIQRMKADPVTGKVPYSGVVDCIRKVWRAEGPAVFYSGYPTYYFRIAPHAMITLLVVDALNKQIKSKYNQ
eukprot:GHVT01076308.1.p1 GENE.GHVT01076308.1~~GHVT01076308.1.p1  ORF type:complete len:425 (+),score=79.69 GHVT01076308.1:161-1276(+)